MYYHTCPYCGAELPEEASFCPYCARGVRARTEIVPPNPAWRRRVRRLLAVLVPVLLLAGLGAGW